MTRSSSTTSRWTSTSAVSWSTTLFDALDSRQHRLSSSPLSDSASPASSSSPKPHSSNPHVKRHRSSSFRALSSRRSPLKLPVDAPTLSSPARQIGLHDLTLNFNPFHYYSVRFSRLFEVILLTSALIFASYRLANITPNHILVSVPHIPLALMVTIIFVVPLLTLFRRSPTSTFQIPFTDARGYRDELAADDGVAIAISLPILLASACLWDTYSSAVTSQLPEGGGLQGIQTLFEIWESTIGEKAGSAGGGGTDQIIDTTRTLFKARYDLLLFILINTLVLLLHLLMSKTILRIENLSKSNAKRFFGFAGLAMLTSTAIWGFLSSFDLPISPLEAAVSSYIQQTSFYCISRLARRGFTLGELSTMTAAGTALCLEFWRLSRARWFYTRGIPFIATTFRTPTPVVVFQTVLIPGAFLSGFLLSPLLVLSRHIAQKPSHRLKWPTERERHRKLLAAGVYVSLVGIVFLLLGGWAGWLLGGSLSRPWMWAIEFIFYPSPAASLGQRRDSTRWKRIGLILYWAGIIVVAVGGWQTHLVRARRIRLRHLISSSASPSKMTKPLPSLSPSSSVPASPTMPTHVEGAGKRNSMALLEMSAEGIKIGVEGAREEKRVHASLNMRRKFFHALAVALFAPGIVMDPSFTSLAFSIAFALFTFSEYARYFALYPIGATLHIFFTEFIDAKDSGPVILSHFYLLSGCASGIWLEGRGVKRLTGVLVLGIGDALASIVGKSIGRVKWPGTTKTIEGTLAFILSILLCAWSLRGLGVVEDFDLVKYAIATTAAALLEATSNQNDNLIIPIYMWSLLSLLDV